MDNRGGGDDIDVRKLQHVAAGIGLQEDLRWD